MNRDDFSKERVPALRIVQGRASWTERILMALSILIGWFAALVVAILAANRFDSQLWENSSWVGQGLVLLAIVPVLAILLLFRCPLISDRWDPSGQFNIVVVLVASAAPLGYWLGNLLLMFVGL